MHKITLINYSPDYFEKRELSINECPEINNPDSNTWINIEGITDNGTLGNLLKCFQLHPLVIEDIFNTNQRPKIEDYVDYIYLVMKNIYLIEKKDKLHSEQISIIIGKNFIITFLEKDGIFLKNIYEKLENEKSRLRKSGIDFLAYSLIDNFVDNYFDIIENIGEKIEYLEEKLVKNPSQALLQKIHAIKKDMIFIRKTVWPLREVINLLERGEIGSISDNTRIYLRDVYDHIIQIVDIIETYRDIVSGMIDIYLSSISNRLNEVMKVLTIISTIFIPLTFITGIYGMNFRFMPEIDYKFGYFIVIGVCLIVVIVMLLYFKRKKWL